MTSTLPSPTDASRASSPVVIDGVRLAWREAGAGPPLLCLHATGHDARDFDDLARRVGGRRRVIALDWPGQGASGPDREPPSAGRYASLARGFVEALDLRDLVLLGNSIGGAAALALAVALPERVRGLVLANPGGLEPVDRLARVATGAMARFFEAGARGARWYPRAFAAYYRMVLPAAPAAARRAEIVASGVAMAPVLAAAWRSFGAPEADQRALAPQVRCPVLVAWAARDRILQLRRSQPAIRRFRDVRLETFRAGHAAFLETPDAFEASLARFLDEVDAAR